MTLWQFIFVMLVHSGVRSVHGTVPASPQETPAGAADDVLAGAHFAQLEKASRLANADVITDDEFVSVTAKVLDLP